MRNDMKKVITECYRLGRSLSYRCFRRKNKSEDGPSQIGMRSQYRRHHSGKEFGENLTPLFRWITKQAGRPWDKVWSEICTNLDPAKTIDKHVRDHVEMFVEKNIVMVDGRPHTSNGSFPLARGTLYVHPNGLLLKVRRGKKNSNFKAREYG